MLTFFKKKVQTPRQSHKVKDVDIHRNALSQEILICNIKFLGLIVQKLLAGLKIFFNSRSNSKVGLRSKLLKHTERSCLIENACEIPKP